MELFKNTSNPEYSQYIHLSRYARWREDLGRRETWEETVARYIDYFHDKYGEGAAEYDMWTELEHSILDLSVMPSMRALATAGVPLDRDNVAGYNCAYVAVDHPRVFDETMYILMCGTGVGFSVERQYINQLPEVAESIHESDTVIRVADSKIGWASAFRELVSLLYAGKIPKWDVTKVRPAGSRLKTFGGRASGPEPLEDLFKFTVELFKEAKGRKLTSIECHDLMCKVAEVVVVGGVRRSAMISLSNLTDDRMRRAKSGQWWEDNSQRSLANNSVCYTEKPDAMAFIKEWQSLGESKSGERGIFNRVSAQKAAGKSGRRETNHDFGTNPCSEIVLRPKQFCNLTEVVVRENDTLDDLKRKVRVATILGTLQATLTDFRYLRSIWKKNTEEEALLGVSMTGIMDNEMLSSGSEVLKLWLEELREIAVETNREWADRLGINPSAAITCVKPSGTVSQLVDSASGIHPRYSSFYVRRVRADKKDPLAQMMVEQGFPVEEDFYNPSNLVFSFPIKAPESAVKRNDVDAISQLELWKIYQEYWCEHKPSITVYYKDDEFLKVGAWVYDNFDTVSGVSFLPHTDHNYRQAPYEEISEDKYKELVEKMPDANWAELESYEKEDNTSSSHEYACTGNKCELS